MSVNSTWAARLAVSLLVLAVLFALVPIRQLAGAVRGVPPTLWLAALGLFLAGHVIAAFKWQLLLGHEGRIPTRFWLRAHFAGLAANLCLPGIAGGDVVRAEFIRRSFGRGEQVAIAAIVDRGARLRHAAGAGQCRRAALRGHRYVAQDDPGGRRGGARRRCRRRARARGAQVDGGAGRGACSD